MKILIFNLNFDLSPFIYNDTLYLDKRHDVRVLCETSDIDERFDNSKVYQFSRNEDSLKSKFSNFLISHDLRLSHSDKNLRTLFKKYIDDFKPDIIQCHYGDESLILLDNINHNNIPIVVMFHGYDASAWIRNKTYVNKYKNIFKSSNISAITCSNDMKSRLISKGFPEEKMSVLYYGIDLNFYSKESQEKNDVKTFTQIAVFRRKKGIEYTIRAFKLYSERHGDRDFKLILGGEGVLKEKMINLCKELNIQDLVEFPGWLDQNGVKKLLNRSDYFIYHSVTGVDGDMEGIPNSIIEAMAMELPVISTYHSGIPELVENKVNGFLVPERDIQKYSEAIASIVPFNKLELNKEKVEHKFNLKKRNKNIEEYLLSLAQ